MITPAVVRPPAPRTAFRAEIAPVAVMLLMNAVPTVENDGAVTAPEEDKPPLPTTAA